MDKTLRQAAADTLGQLDLGNWRDDHGHDVRMNAAILDLRLALGREDARDKAIKGLVEAADDLVWPWRAEIDGDTPPVPPPQARLIAALDAARAAGLVT